jgi:CRP-like cAMP-binding protein
LLQQPNTEAELTSGGSSQPSGRKESWAVSPENRVFAKARLFAGLSSPEVNEILRLAVRHKYRTNSVLAEQGNRADRLFLLVSGSARYFFITPEGQKVYLFWLMPGDAFGGASLLTEPAEFLVSTEATLESVALVWQRDVIRTIATKHPRVFENSLSIACDYLVWYLATHLSLVCHTARERLAHVLVSLAHGIGRRTPSGISLEITNEQLANTANITSFTVSRLLSGWQRVGLISKDRGKLLLYYPEKLLHHPLISVPHRSTGTG